jgi:uncharacterized delta-60 repeat protein
MHLRALPLITLIALAAPPPMASAAPGDLDPAFGIGGLVRDPMPDNGAQAKGVAIDASGRIVVAGTTSVNVIDGNFGVLRLDSNGSPDASFGNGGRVSYGYVAGSGEEAYGVAVQADGRIVVGGTSFTIPTLNDFAALRLEADGSIDTSFGNHGDGWMTTGRADNDIGIALAASPSGIFLGGYVADGGGGIDAAGFLLDTLGMPAPLFGDNGLVTAGADSNSAHAAAMQPDGKLLLGGHLDNGGGIIMRFGADGSPDASFAGDGRAELGDDTRIEDLGVLADGRIVAAGHRLSDAIVMRLLADGSLDASFGVGGVATLSATSVGAVQLFGRALAVQSDGAIVVAGNAISLTNGSLLLAFRVTPNGALDAGFGTAGARLVDAPNDLFGEAIALQADGAIVIAGSDRGADDQFLVARLLGGSGAGGLPVVSVADASLAEGDAGTALMSFTLSLGAPSDGSVSVDVATDLGSATPNVDYTPTTATLTFPNGATSLVFQVPVIGDTVPEPDETFLVRLSSPVNATLGDAEAIGTIFNDDDVIPPPAETAPVPGPGLPALGVLAGLLAIGAWLARRRNGSA